MRREGYELQVSRPEVIVQDDQRREAHEPLERGVVDVPDEHVGTVTQALAPRKGRVTDLRPGDPGRTVVTFEAPARGLIGFRGMLLTATRGTALLHTHHAGWMPWAGELPAPPGRRHDGRPDRARPPATRSTTSRPRGELFVGPGEPVYEGMVVGESSRPDDMVVNVRPREAEDQHPHPQPRRGRSSSHRPEVHTLETAIEWIAEDELVEVTPDAIRIRKRVLAEQDRRRLSRKTRRRAARYRRTAGWGR